MSDCVYQAFMNYFESVVFDFLRADRAVFINTECCIQKNQADNPDNSGPHWYCDAVAVDFRSEIIFLCEVSYSESLGALGDRLRGWHEHWEGVCNALKRDSHLPSWPVQPWLFVPECRLPVLRRRLAQIEDGKPHFTPRITTLEAVQPWSYCSWNRIGEGQ